MIVDGSLLLLYWFYEPRTLLFFELPYA